MMPESDLILLQITLKYFSHSTQTWAGKLINLNTVKKFDLYLLQNPKHFWDCSEENGFNS